MIADLKPYAEYKESGLPWLGRVPGHWASRRMKFLFRETSQKGFPTESLLAATQSKGVVRKEDYGSRTVTAMNGLENLKLVEVGDFVISLRSFQGGIEVSHARGIISPAYTVLRPRVGFEPRYFKAYFKSPALISSLTLFVTGIREGQNIDYERLSRAFMPLPPPAEQAAIVRFLDWVNGRLERAVRAKRKVIALLNEQKQAIIHRAVTRGLDPSVPLKPSGIPWLGDIPAHWEVMPLKFLCRRIQNGATPSTSEQRYYENGTVPWFGPSSISSSSELGRPVRHLSNTAFEDGKARLISGPAILVIVIGATAGKMSLLLGDGATNQQITAFELKSDRIAPQFGIQQLRTSEHWLKSTASTATIPILDSGVVNRLPLAFPTVGEQECILSALSNHTRPLATAISRLEREIDLLREYRTRLVADIVTGKLDVREAAARLPDEEPLLDTPDTGDTDPDDDLATDEEADA